MHPAGTAVLLPVGKQRDKIKAGQKGKKRFNLDDISKLGFTFHCSLNLNIARQYEIQHDY